MMKLSVDIKGLDAAKARLRGLSEKKIAVATVSALNAAAYLTSQKQKEDIARVFDRPTAWVKGGVRYIKADRARMESKVDLDFWGNKQGVSVEKILSAQIYGGQRRHKRHEIALQRALVLPAGMFIVPGAAANLDSYGNMSSGQIVQIISWFRGFAEGGRGSRANMKDATRKNLAKGKKSNYGFEYFYVSPNAKGPRGGHQHLLPGVYQRVKTGFGSAIRPVMIFVKKTSYAKRFDFYGNADKVARKEFDRAFPFYLNQLLSERGL